MRNIFLILLLVISLFSESLHVEDKNETISLNEDELFQSDRDSGFSLHDAIVNSLNRNYKIKASNERIYQGKRKVEEQEAGHLPTIDLSGNAGLETRKIQSGDIKSGPKTTTKMDYHKTELYITIKENLWTGGKIEASINEQEHKLDAALFDHRNTIEKATINMIEAYFGVVYAEIAVKISTHNMKSYEKILKIVRIKEENGASTKGDVNFIKANVDNAKTSLINDQAKLSNEMAKYNYYMQEVDETNLPYETEANLATKELNASIEYMYDNNAILLRQKSYIASSSEAIKVKNGNYHPIVDFVINGETKDEFNTGIGQRDKANALITFTYNLYKGGKDEASYLRVLSKMSEQKYIYHDEKNKLIFDIKVLHRSTLSMDESLALTRDEVIAARKVVNSYWIAFKHGTQDLQALQLAQRNLNRAQLDYINYKKTFIINNFKLMQKTGELLKFLDIANNNFNAHAKTSE